MQEVDYDLIVIGAGGAGLAGAIWAAQAGCKVIVLESEARIGGSTALSDGVFNAADTSLQHKLGLTDSKDAYFDYYMTLNAWRQPAALIRTFCDQATPTLEWLMSIGVSYPERIAKKPKNAVFASSVEGGGLYSAGVEYPPRGHCPAEGGKVYIDVMDNQCGVLGVQTVLNTRVQQLLIEEGRVVGVIAEGETLRAHAVLLACGGITHAAPELVARYFPDAYDTLPAGYHPTGPAGAGHRGDGLLMGLQAGAEIVGVNCGLAVPAPFLPNAPAGWHGNQPASLIYVNGKGHRFADETAPYAVMPGLIKEQGHNCWGVFDEAARLRSDPTKGGVSQGWAPQFVLESVARSDILAADTVELLDEKCGMRPGALRTAVDEYNEDLPSGVDRRFLRTLDGLFPISQGPFYAFRFRNTSFTVTNVGPKIDAEAHVLNEDGQIIPGLFAAGENGAGVLGERYVGGGNAVANAITMGRIAGMTVGREVRARASTQDGMENAA
jgi:succinate dehydrogenase/fumarate reductase flavoprotein subunit